MYSRKRIASKKPCKLQTKTLLVLRIFVTFWKLYVSKLFTGTLLHVSMFKLFIESVYIENNLIYFNLNKGDVLIFNQSLKALSDHLLIGF